MICPPHCTKTGMIAIIEAYARGFLRDRPGLALSLLLPPIIYLLFAAIFGGSGRGDIDASVSFANLSRTPASHAVGMAMRESFDRLSERDSVAAVEAAVVNGLADAGVILRDGGSLGVRVEVLAADGRDAAAAVVMARMRAIHATVLQGASDNGAVSRRRLGPAGDFQAAYYAAAVSVMFVFFAAMHGAMGGLDERRSGLQARLVLATGGLASVLGARLVWLTAVGVAQSIAVFATAAPNLPPLRLWQIAAGLVTATTAALAAAGFALMVIAACRSREQAQPLSAFLVLVLAALGGSMAPRFLMPATFQSLGWATPHAWAIETWQTLLWLGRFDTNVLTGWTVLAGLGLVGWLVALLVERRRLLA